MDLFNILAFSWNWCNTGNGSILPVLHMIKMLLNVIRIVVPIGLIAFTTFDVVKKVINPDDKDGQKRIISRIIAAVLVFFAGTGGSSGNGRRLDDRRADRALLP